MKKNTKKRNTTRKSKEKAEGLKILKHYVELVHEVAATDYSSGKTMPNPMLQLMVAMIRVQAAYEDDMAEAALKS